MSAIPHPMALDPRHQRFVDEYLVDLNASAAYIRAGYSEQGAGQAAHKLLNNAEIQEAITSGRNRLQAATGATAEWVLSEWFRIASADPNELIEHRMANCRHCHGQGFRHQYTDHEFAKKRAAWTKERNTIGSRVTEGDEDGFDYEGGAGFNKHRKPNPDCPECRGVGETVIVPRDTRELSPAARALYAGVRVTATGGFEIKMKDQGRALENIAKHLGMFVERQAMVNPDGSKLDFAPIMFAPVEAKPRDPEES